MPAVMRMTGWQLEYPTETGNDIPKANLAEWLDRVLFLRGVQILIRIAKGKPWSLRIGIP